ncbi:O-antigen ligase family protein [Gelidibacter sediminis]|nr:O-antigen ligase family protein [Gelidibacter sediminis]
MLNVLKLHNREKIQTVLLCGIAAMLLFKNYSNVVIVMAAVYNIICFNRKNFYKLKSYAFIFPSVFLLVAVISSFFSKNMDEGFNSIQLYLLPMLIGISILNSKIDRLLIIKVCQSFFLASVVSATILISYASYKIIGESDIQDIIFHGFTAFYDQHPVYYAVLLSLALFYASTSKSSQLNKYLKRVGAVILIIALILCASKIVLVVNAIAYLYLLGVEIKANRQNIIYLFGFIAVVTIIYHIPFVKERFVDGLKMEKTTLEFQPTNNFRDKKLFTYTEKQKISDLELRYILWHIGVYHLIEDGKLLTGYGQGDVQDYLDYYYYSYNLAPNWNEGRNIHNQYLHVWVTYGLLMFLLFIGYMIYSLRAAIISKDRLHLFFIGVLSIVFIFEVMLVRNLGINLFYFFNTLFLIKTIYFEDSHPRNQRHTQQPRGI